MRAFNVRTILLAAVLGGVMLPGCTWVNDFNQWPPEESSAPARENAAPTPPQSRLMQTPDATWLVPATPAEAPVEHKIPRTGQSSDALNRISELEAEVTGLRNEISMMMPAMTKLAETQSALRDAVTERTAATSAASSAAAAASVAPQAGVAPYEPMPLYNPQKAETVSADAPAAMTDPDAAYVPPSAVPQATPVAAPVPMAAAGGLAVAGIRFSDNAGKTRMVLDVPGETEYSHSIDSSSNILTIRLPRAGWAAAPAGGVSTGFAGSYNAAPDGAGGTILAVRLQAPARVDMTQSLPAGNGKPHRIIIDLAAP